MQIPPFLQGDVAQAPDVGADCVVVVVSVVGADVEVLVTATGSAEIKYGIIIITIVRVL